MSESQPVKNAPKLYQLTPINTFQDQTNLTQVAIGERLGYAQGAVSEMMKDARGVYVTEKNGKECVVRFGGSAERPHPFRRGSRLLVIEIPASNDAV